MRICKQQIQTITCGDMLFPKEWLNFNGAPAMVQAIGNIALLKERKFTVVGSRRTPTAALRIGADIVKQLSHAFTIVTGAADGGDAAAIEGALQAGGKIICVLAGGFSAIPQGNLALLERVAEHGLLLSPYPYDTPVRSFSYEYRNRLLALLGEGTLVLGAAEKSGALITARYAKDEHKKIFALPYSPGVTAGAGCNALIKNGAYLTETAEDILQQYSIVVHTQKPQAQLSEDEEKLLTALRELSTGHIVELSAKSGIPAFKARAILSALEVKGLCVAVGGNQYAPV